MQCHPRANIKSRLTFSLFPCSITIVVKESGFGLHSDIFGQREGNLLGTFLNGDVGLVNRKLNL